MEDVSESVPLIKDEAVPLKAKAKWWKTMLKALVAGGILAYLLYKIPFASIWAAILEAKWQLLVLSTFMTLLVHWTTADRLRRLLEVSGNKITTWGIFEINLSTLFYGLFLPGGNFTGIAIRFYRLSADKGDALATGVALFTDRVISTITLLLVGIVFWLGARQEEGWYPLLIMLGALAASIGVIFLFLVAEKIPLLRPLYGLAMRYGKGPARKIHDALHKQAKLPVRTLVVVFSLSILTHLLGIVAYALIARSLGIEVGLVAMGWIRSSIILATMIPLTPSGIGLREGASLLLLTSLGVTNETAMAFSLLIFGMTILLVGLVGGLFEARRVTKF
ncbi:lysylphosphatidylglycerol synthase transmembrane domain-containing protein [Haloferula sp.]|uniref:lysylphosphatidylglycerol synthase transmembrane domain-containing protein n=1 Tax=Haloferula sp. TaxID=2497595 RepID=UPI003C7142B4